MQLKPPLQDGAAASGVQHLPRIQPAFDPTPTPLNGAVSFVTRHHKESKVAEQSQQGLFVHDGPSKKAWALQQDGSEVARQSQIDALTHTDKGLVASGDGESKLSSPVEAQPQTGQH